MREEGIRQEEKSPRRLAYDDTLREFNTERNALGSRLNDFSNSPLYRAVASLKQIMNGYEKMIRNAYDSVQHEQNQKDGYKLVEFPREWAVDSMTPFCILGAYDPINHAHIERRPPRIFEGANEGLATSAALRGWIEEMKPRWERLAKEPMGKAAQESNSHYQVRLKLDSSFSAHLRAMQAAADKITGILSNTYVAREYDDLVNDLDSYTRCALEYQTSREQLHTKAQEARELAATSNAEIIRTSPDLLLKEYENSANSESPQEIYQASAAPYIAEAGTSHAARVSSGRAMYRNTFGPALKKVLKEAGAGGNLSEIHEKLDSIPRTTLSQVLGGSYHPSESRRDIMLELVTDRTQKKYLLDLWKQDASQRGHKK